jgi:hypothetical protein
MENIKLFYVHTLRENVLRNNQEITEEWQRNNEVIVKEQ